MIIKEISIGDIRRIEFKNGLNIIVGTHGKSSNGVGKSLLVAFIRYCFGNGATLQENLKRYKDILNIENVELILEEVNLKTKKLTRDITDKNINKNKLNIIYPSTKNLTESLILSRFIRESHSYHDYLKSSNTKESNEATQKAVSFLLGLDIERIDKRISFRSELQSLNETKKRLNAIIKEEESRVGINKHEKEKYEADLKDVKIAKNYTTIVEENNKLANALQDKRNQSLQLEYDLESIEKSLYITEDLTKEDVEGFFNEVNFQIPNIIVNRLSDIQNFNRILIQDRQEVLKSQKNAIIYDLRQIKNEIQSLEMKVDKNFEYLKEHKAIDEYVAITDKISKLSFELAKFEDAKKERNIVDSRIREIEGKIADEDIKTESFLEDNADKIDNIIKLFAEIAENVYKANCGNLTIKKHEGNSESNRYDFVADIKKDDSNGINNVKTFCWDWTLFLSQKATPIDFLCHDSEIFDGVDPVQIKEMIKFAKKMCQLHNKQYIVSINYSDFEHIRNEIDETKDIVLRLSDTDNTSNLLLRKEVDDFKY